MAFILGVGRKTAGQPRARFWGFYSSLRHPGCRIRNDLNLKNQFENVSASGKSEIPEKYYMGLKWSFRENSNFRFPAGFQIKIVI